MNTQRSVLLRAALRTLVVSAMPVAAVHAQSISLNFTDSDPNSTVNTGTPGAIPIASTFWNNLNSSAGDGNVTGLMDNSGVAGPAAINWISANTWRSGLTPTTGNGQLTKGYLDDGGGGCQITVSGIPYLSYNAYVIVASDQGGGTQGNANYRPVSVNGVAYSHNDTATVAANANWTGQNFTDAALVEGQNYLKITNLGGQTLNVRGGNNSGGFRGPIAGLQIENTYTGAFRYWDLNGATAGAGGATPAGTWDGAATNWNAAADGTGATAAWPGAGHSAVFSAGGDATGVFTVNLSGTRTADAVLVEQGNLTLSGGTLDLAAPAVVRVFSGASLTLNTTLSGTSGVVLEGGSDINLSGTHGVSGAAIFTIPSLILNSGTSFPNLGGLVVGSNSTIIADTSTLNLTGAMTVGNGGQINSAGSTFAAGGAVSFNGAGYSGSGSSSLSGSSLFLNNGTAAASMALTNTSTVNLTATAPAQATFELNSGALTMGDSSTVNTDRWVNRGSGLTHTLTISGNAQLNVTDDLVLGDNSNAAITVTQTGGTVTNTGTTNNPGGNDMSNRWGHWGGGTTVYNLSAGTLNLQGAPLYLSWDGAATLNVSGTGLANLQGVDMGFGTRTQASTINLTGGRLNIGAAGIVTGGTTNKTINLGAGTLGALDSWASTVAMNVTAAHTIDTGAFDINLGGALGGTGSIVKTGTGTLGLGGTNTYPGPTDINAGALRLGGSTAGTVNIASTAELLAGTPVLPGTGTAGSLNLANGSSSTFRIGATSDGIVVTAPNGLTTNTAHTINIAGAAGMGPGTYPLFDYDTAISGTGAGAFVIGSMPHIVATLNHNVANTAMELEITAVDSLVWTGANGSAWDLNSAQNWSLASNSNAAPYFQTDMVLFDDTATTGNVVLTGTITPGDVMFNNSTLDYTLSGAGIAGPTDLIKDGAAKLTLLNDNTYVGSTVVNAGTLQVGDGTSGSLDPLSPVVVAPGAEFILHPAASGNFPNTVNNDGTFRLVGTVDTNLNGTWGAPNSGNIIVDSTGITSFTTGKPDWSGNLTVNAGTLRTTGFATSSLGQGSNLRTLTFNGPDTVLSMEQNNIFGGGGTTFTGIPVLVLTGGATLTSTDYNVLGDVTLNGSTISGASEDESADYRGFELRGAITVTGSSPSLIETTTAHENHLDTATPFTVEDVTGSAATDLLVSAPLRNASPDNGSIVGGLVKLGAGTMELTGTGTYTGTTDVQEGTLKVNTSLTSASILLATGTTLAGNGSTTGSVTAAAGSFIAPGASAGTFSAGGDVALNGTLLVELDGSSGDKLDVGGALDITTATVDFSVLGGGATLPVYVIAEYTTLTGAAFATVNNLPAGYTLVYDHGANSNQIALVDPSADPYLTWATSPPYNLSGGNELPGVDADGDGLANAIEFVLGGNPANANDNDKRPTGAVSGGNFVFTFRRTDLSNYSPVPFVEYGSTLSGWTPAENGVNGVSIVVTDDFYGAGIDRVVVSIPQALATGQKLFARLNANP